MCWGTDRYHVFHSFTVRSRTCCICTSWMWKRSTLNWVLPSEMGLQSWFWGSVWLIHVGVVVQIWHLLILWVERKYVYRLDRSETEGLRMFQTKHGINSVGVDGVLTPAWDHFNQPLNLFNFRDHSEMLSLSLWHQKWLFWIKYWESGAENQVFLAKTWYFSNPFLCLKSSTKHLLLWLGCLVTCWIKWV